MTEATVEAGPAVVSLDSVLPPEPEYDIAPPPKRDVPTSRESAEAIEKAAPKRRGRPPKPARTTKDTTPPAKKGAPKKPLEKKDFTQDLTATTDALWVVGSTVPQTAPYAAILKANQAGLVQALNAGANQNATVRAYVEKLSGNGDANWLLQLGMVGMQMGMHGLQLARDPEFKAQLIEANSKALQSYLSQFQAPESATSNLES